MNESRQVAKRILSLYWKQATVTDIKKKKRLIDILTEEIENYKNEILKAYGIDKEYETKVIEIEENDNELENGQNEA